MVVVRLWGGLGNQMFQYACGYAIAKKNNTDLKMDTRFFTEDFQSKNPHFSKQSLNLFQFPLEYTSTVNEDNSFKLIGILQNRTVSRMIRIPYRFNIRVDNFLYCKETRLSYLGYVHDICEDNIYLDGYWQCEKYFKNYEYEIRRQFAINNEDYALLAGKYGMLEENAISLHIRLGDFSAKKIHNSRVNSLMDPEYYYTAIQLMSKRVRNPVFYVFSNDVLKAKEILKGYPCVFMSDINNFSDIDEFELMSICRNHIISNSTFSWWAAWLSAKAGGYTIAPDRFAGNSSAIPEEWIKIRTKI